MIRYPKLIPAGMVRDEMVLNIDAPVTLLDRVDIEAPDTTQERSFLPLARGQSLADCLYGYYEYPQADPGENHNLYAKPAYEELTASLRSRLEELRRETGDGYVYHPSRVLCLKSVVVAPEPRGAKPTRHSGYVWVARHVEIRSFSRARRCCGPHRKIDV